MALFHYIGYFENKESGKPLEGGVVIPYIGGVAQTTYADESLTPKLTVESDANGFFDFYIAYGEYDLSFIYGGVEIDRVPDVDCGLAFKYTPAGVGSVPWTVEGKLRDLPVSVKDFGVVGDGIVDDTQNFYDALDAAISATSNPLRWNGTQLLEWGQTTLTLPKGRFKITAPWASAAAAIGLKIQGAGKWATTIEYYGDTDHFLDPNIHIALTFSDLSVVHVATDPSPAAWTCNFLQLNGFGGGRNLNLERAHIEGFNRVINYVDQSETPDDVNCDTFLAVHSDFLFNNEVLYARNAQALINKFLACTLHGHGDGLNIAGLGHTQFDTCNITLDGVTLNLFGVAGLWGDASIFSFDNTKWEPANFSAHAGGSRSAITRLAGDKGLIQCAINLRSSGFTAGVALDATYRQLETTSNMRVKWDGGTLMPDARILLSAAEIAVPTRGYSRGLFFEGMERAPVPTQIDRSAASGAQSYPQVVYKESYPVGNLTVASGGDSAPVTLDHPDQLIQLGSDLYYYHVLSDGSDRILYALFHGAHQEIEDIYVDVQNKAAGTLRIRVSLDNFTTTLDDFNHPETAAATYCPRVSVKAAAEPSSAINVVSTVGVYVKLSGCLAFGRVYAKVRAR